MLDERCRAGDDTTLVAVLVNVAYTSALGRKGDTADTDVGCRDSAIAATEYDAVAATVDNNAVAQYSRSVTATVSFIDSVLASVDGDMGLLDMGICLFTGKACDIFSITDGRSIVSLVAATIDIIDSEVAVVCGITVAVGGGMSRLVDVNEDILLRRTVEIVATIDGGTLKVGRARRIPCRDRRFCRGVSWSTWSTDIDLHHAIDNGCDSFIFKGFLSTSATTIDNAIEGTTENIDSGSIAAVGIDVAEGRSAVEFAINNGGVGTGGVAHGHLDIASDLGGLTESAAENLSSGCTGTDLTAKEVDGGVATDGTVFVATSIDTAGNTASGKGDLCVPTDTIGYNIVATAIEFCHIAVGVVIVVVDGGAACHSSGVTAAEDGAGDNGSVGSGVVANGYHRAAGDDGRGTFTAAEDDAVNKVTHGAVVDIHHRTASVGRQVAGTEDAVDGERTSATKVGDIDGDGATNRTVNVATAKSCTNGAAVKGQRDIAGDIGSFVNVTGSQTTQVALGAAEDATDGTALDGEGDIASDFGLVGATVDGTEGTGTALDSGVDITIDVHHVTATEELVHFLVATAFIVDSDNNGTAD